MKVISIGTDTTMLDDISPTRERMIEYAGLVQELHIILYTIENEKQNTTKRHQIARNAFVYPTHSRAKHKAIQDAYSIAHDIIISDLDGAEDVKRAADVSQTSQKNNRVLRSIFGGTKTVNLNILRASPEKARWLVTTQDPFETGLVGARLKKTFSIPFHVQVHTDFLSKYFWKGSLKDKGRVLVGEKVLKGADCVRVVSERIKASIEKAKLLKEGASISVLPIHVEVTPKRQQPIFSDIKKGQNDREVFDLKSEYPEHDFIMLMASRLSREKNIMMAIEAMKVIVRTHPNALLVIVGSGPEEKRLRDAAKKLERNVVFQPWMQNLDAYYQTADLFLLTSDYEGYGRTVIEAQLHGLPVVMTDVGCAGWLVRDGEGVLVVPVQNKNMFTKRVVELMESPETLKKLSKRASRVSERLISKIGYLEALRADWLQCRNGS